MAATRGKSPPVPDDPLLSFLDLIHQAWTSGTDSAAFEVLKRGWPEWVDDRAKGHFKWLETVRSEKLKATPQEPDSATSRPHHVVEALLNSKKAGKEVLWADENGGIVDAYVLYANEANDPPYRQVHHGNRHRHLVLPTENPRHYGEIRASLKSKKSRQTASERHEESQAREDVDAYIVEARRSLKEAQARFHGGEDLGIYDIPFIRQLSLRLANRTDLEQTCQVLLVEEGELFFGVFLHRLATDDTKPATKTSRLTRRRDNPLTLPELEKAGVLIRTTKNKVKPSAAAQRMFRWLGRLCSNPACEKLRTTLLCNPRPPGGAGCKTKYPFGFGLNCRQQHTLSGAIEAAQTQPCKWTDCSTLLGLLLRPNGHPPLTKTGLADILHFDPFVMDVFLRPYEKTLPDTNPNGERSVRSFFVLPLDPVTMGPANAAEDVRGPLSREKMFVVWVGFCDGPKGAMPTTCEDENARSDLSRRCRRMRTILNAIGQPVAREVVEEDLRAALAQSRSNAARTTGAVLSARNMAHNMGSHVLAFVSSHGNLQPKLAQSSAASEISVPALFVNDLQSLLALQRSRMTFIAYLATLTPTYGIPSTVQNILHEFTAQTLLLQGLVVNEDYGTVTLHESLDDSAASQLLFSLSLGELGRQALFAILEGIVRNSAKHGPGPGRKGAPLNLYWRVIKGDEIDNCGKGTLALEVWDNEGTFTRAAAQMHLGANSNDARRADRCRISNPQDGLPVAFWGIAELRVCALFLNKRPASDLDNPLRQCLTLDAHTNATTGKRSLLYRIRLPRMRYCTFVTTRADAGELLKRNAIESYAVMNPTPRRGPVDDSMLMVCENSCRITTVQTPRSISVCSDTFNSYIEQANADNHEALIQMFERDFLGERQRNSLVCLPPSDCATLGMENDQTTCAWQRHGFLFVLNDDSIPAAGEVLLASHLDNEDMLQQILLPPKDADSQRSFQYIQPFSIRNHLLKHIVTHDPAPMAGQLFVLSLRLAAHATILILDERIFRCYDRPRDGRLEYSGDFLWKQQRIAVGSLSDDRKAILDVRGGPTMLTTKEWQGSTRRTRSKWCKMNGISSVTFLIVHLGILEKARTALHFPDLGSCLNALRGCMCARHVVVESGRHKPGDFAIGQLDGVFWCDHETIAAGLREGKWLLAETLYSLREVL